MTLTDSHTHLNSPEFTGDFEQMFDRALAAGVTRFFIPSVESSGAASIYALEQKCPENVFAMIGLHPVYVKPETVGHELDFVRSELQRRRFCAVGEIGIDLYWDKTTLGIQQQAFSEQIRLAKQYGLPINIHCREAFDEVFEVLESERADDLRGIFHCFTGNHDQALQALSYNLKLGIGGVATFKNGQIDKFLGQIPIEHIVLETDAPYLAPAPFRGKRNESSYLLTIAQKISAIYDLPLAQVADITTANSIAVYGI